MKDFIRVFGAFPIARTDAGEVVADHDTTARCPDARRRLSGRRANGPDGPPTWQAWHSPVPST
jgi:hypothetical protein